MWGLTVFTIHIPSYRRPEAFHTLEFLRGCGVPDDHIHLYLNDDTDACSYAEKNDLGRVKVIVMGQGVQSVVDARNYILTHNPYPLIMMDDDITGFNYVTRVPGGKFRYQERNDMFVPTVERLLSKCMKEHVSAFGFTPNRNALFAASGKKGYSYNRFVWGTFMCFLEQPTLAPPWCVVAEDAFYQIAFHAAGKRTLRFNLANFRKQIYQLGGCNTMTWRERWERDQDIRARLIALYGDPAKTLFDSVPWDYDKYDEAHHRSIEKKRAARQGE